MRSLLYALLLTFALCHACPAQTDPDYHGSISVGYEYLDAQGANGQYTSLNGWDVVPALALTKNVDVFFSVNGFYAPGQNVHAFTGGPLYKLPKHGRLTPFLFTEVGDARSSLAGKITNAFAYTAGGGFLFKIKGPVSLQFIPAEYVLTLPGGNVRNNFNAFIGLTFAIKPR